jgi:hypothetical protein
MLFHPQSKELAIGKARAEASNASTVARLPRRDAPRGGDFPPIHGWRGLTTTSLGANRAQCVHEASGDRAAKAVRAAIRHPHYFANLYSQTVHEKARVRNRRIHGIENHGAHGLTKAPYFSRAGYGQTGRSTLACRKDPVFFAEGTSRLPAHCLRPSWGCCAVAFVGVCAR